MVDEVDGICGIHGRIRNSWKIELRASREESDHLGNLGMDWRMILKGSYRNMV
jgi:hypothetical protein